MKKNKNLKLRIGLRIMQSIFSSKRRKREKDLIEAYYLEEAATILSTEETTTCLTTEAVEAVDNTTAAEANTEVNEAVVEVAVGIETVVAAINQDSTTVTTMTPCHLQDMKEDELIESLKIKPKLLLIKNIISKPNFF